MRESSPQPYDPLKRTLVFAYGTEVYPLGFPVVVRSSHEAAIAIVRQCWPGPAKRADPPLLEIQIGVFSDGELDLPPEPAFHARWHLTTIVANRRNFATIDGSQGKAFIWVSEAVMANSDYFRWFFLEAAVYIVLAERELTPIHAACVAKDTRGVLLLGESGAGKSTLAFECARSGWQFVADDASWLARREPGLRILAPPHRIRLRPDCAHLFPELRDRPVNVSLPGKHFLDVDLRQLPGFALASECQAAASVLLCRDGTAPPAVRAVTPEAAYAHLVRELVVYDSPAREEQLASLRRLAAAPSYELHYGDANAAAKTLSRLG